MLISNRRLFYGFNWDIFPNFRSKTWKIMETRPDMKTPRSSMVPKIDSGCSLYKCRSTDLKLRKLGVYHGLSKISIGWVTLPNDMISTLPSQVSGYYDIMSDIFGYQHVTPNMTIYFQKHSPKWLSFSFRPSRRSFSSRRFGGGDISFSRS